MCIYIYTHIHMHILLLLSRPVMSDSLQPHGLQHARPPSRLLSWSLPKFRFISSVMPSSHLILWRPLLLLSSIFPSIKEFSSESSVRIRWPKYWSFSFSISPSSECSGLISLKIDWFNLLVAQGTFRSLLQHHRLKTSVLWCSAFFMAQLSQLYVTPGKTIALTIGTFVGRVIFLFFYTLSLSLLSCQEAVVFWFHGCSHHLHWLWSPRRGNLSILPLFPLLFAMH